MATYINSYGQLENDEFGPEIKTFVEKSNNNGLPSKRDIESRTRFDFLKPNTNYTVNVCAVTRRKECGKVRYINLHM